MITYITPKLATLLQENQELRDLLQFLTKEANFLGQKGQTISNIKVHIKKKNPFLLRFFTEASIEWEENS